MLLIFPPVAKPGEPPAGLAKLAGALRANGIPATLLDANLEGLLFLFDRPCNGWDTWTRRAGRNSSANIAQLREADTYRVFDRYSRAVNDLNRVLEMCGREQGIRAGLADYQDAQLSPVRSADLIRAAEHPEINLFYPYFSARLPEVIGISLKEKGIARKQDNLSVGFSLNYLSQALCTFAMIGFIKKEFPGLRIVLGGGLITSWVKRGLKEPLTGLADHLVAGPGEAALLNLLGADHARSAPPDYSGLPLRQYLSPGIVLPYSASTGCYWNKCSFCPEPAEHNPYVPVPVNDAMREIHHLVAGTQPDLIHFLDNAISPALMQALAEMPPGIPWYGFARIDKHLLDRDYCIALKHSGCRMLKLGLESGDQSVLDRLQKGIDLETASRALNNLRSAGIATYVYLLFGTPAETLGSARKTLDFVVRHRHAITFLNLAVFNMPVCGQEAKEFGTEQFYEGDLSLYTAFRHPAGWDRRQVRLFLDNEFRKEKTIAAILKHDPPIFTSNHAAFFQ